MDAKKLQLRSAVLADAQDILTWRNDAVSRKMSGSNKFITETNHLKWLEKTLENPNTNILIFFDEQLNAKIGMVRIQLNDELFNAEISINLNPEFRGKGYGQSCLIYAADYVSATFPGCFDIDAIVREENGASIKTFTSVGYHEVSRKDGFIHFKLNLQ